MNLCDINLPFKYFSLLSLIVLLYTITFSSFLRTTSASPPKCSTCLPKIYKFHVMCQHSSISNVVMHKQ